jgi:predicted MFS family arabinose efflux permease
MTDGVLIINALVDDKIDVIISCTLLLVLVMVELAVEGEEDRGDIGEVLLIVVGFSVVPPLVIVVVVVVSDFGSLVEEEKDKNEDRVEVL